MTWRLHPLPPVLEATAAAVEAVFPKGNLDSDMQNELGVIDNNDLFADLYSDWGHPAVVAAPADFFWPD